MRLRLQRLELKFQDAAPTIAFSDLSYFHGQMGAGKSSIARLIDYCLGGKLEPTPALQSEFLSAVLHLEVGSVPTEVRRDRDAHFAWVRTTLKGEPVELKLPVRTPNGEIIKGSGIEVLSDLILTLGGVRPPRVRKSKHDHASDLERLSLRDLLWFCYLDQDEFDSNFFHLGLDDANPYKRNKSREVLRYVLGFHQEEVSSLEQRLEYLRIEKQACETAMVTLRDALLHAKIAPDFAWENRKADFLQRQREVEAKLADVRKQSASLRPHGVDEVQMQARNLAAEIEAVRNAIAELRTSIRKDKSHADELRSLSFRHKRASSARAVLGGVEFKSCPRCTQVLPSRAVELCPLCGQSDCAESSPEEGSRIDRDVQERIADIEDLVARQAEELARLDREENELAARKRQVDSRLDQLLVEYDSAFLSAAKELQREQGRIEEEIHNVERMGRLLGEVTSLKDRLDKFAAEEDDLLPKLRAARQVAESDLKNVELLRALFLDCLVRSKISGFSPDDQVEMSPKDFLPEISSLKEVAVSSFANMGSGGKKTLFKCCFALALHRVNTRIGGPLPSLMVIDSPMKNISERANRLQFESFHALLYELAATELKDTQFVLVDKESIAPPTGFSRSFSQRLMNPGDPQNPPLIPYYMVPKPENIGEAAGDGAEQPKPNGVEPSA